MLVVALAEPMVAAIIAKAVKVWIMIFMLFPLELVVSETAYTDMYVVEFEM